MLSFIFHNKLLTIVKFIKRSFKKKKEEEKDALRCKHAFKFAEWLQKDFHELLSIF